MSASTQEQGGAPAKPVRRDWELFWRIVAGLMLLVIGWMVWVLYQISPRSVVTPLAYATQVRPIGTQAPASAAPAVAVDTAAKPTEADQAMEAAQAAARAGAHQASADGQAAAGENKPQAIGAQGLKLATEISTPLAQKPANPKTQEGRTAGAPASTTGAAAAGKNRP
jgi:hypothetical protein